MQKSYDVGLYCRLSSDDGSKGESNSISNQREILTGFVGRRNWNLVDIYVDDGYTGTNFDRPDFKRIVSDVESKRINCVVTVDLSRFGRAGGGMDYYLEEFFPINDARFLTCCGDYDSDNPDGNQCVDFQNAANAYYPRECSRKVKAVYKMNAEKGLWIGGNAPYGYQKAPKNNKVLVIDPETAPIVKRIFNEFANLISARAIAEKLTKEGVLTPGDYLSKRKEKPIKGTAWGSATICQMLNNQAYIGNLAQGQRKKLNHKSKVRKAMPKENWIVVEGTHEAIVDKETFAEVQKLRLPVNKKRKPSGKRAESIFVSKVRCADCGGQMSATMRGNKLSYRCGTYSNQGKSVCTAHTIREEVLVAIVLSDIKKYAKFDKENLTKGVLKILQTEKATTSSNSRQKLSKVNAEIEKINTAIKNLYLDKASAKLPENIFFSTIGDFNVELEKLNAKVAELEAEIKADVCKEDDVMRWTELIKQYAEFETLSRQMAHQLIDSIIVSSFYKVDGKTMQDVIINYKFVGNLNSQGKEDRIAV